MISSSLWWMLLLAAVSCVHCVELTQPASSVVSPGEALTLSCKVSGYSLTDSSYCTHWIRQAAGKPLEWIGRICYSGGTDYSNNLKSRFQITRDTSSSTVTLQGQNMRSEDTSVYYCAREYGRGDDYFDYWGKGTQVTVSSAQPSAPQSVFGLSQCGSDPDGSLIVGCIARGFSPADSLSFKWTDHNGKQMNDFVQYPAMGQTPNYIKISHLRVKKSDLDPKKPYKCEATNTAGKKDASVVQALPQPDQPASVYITAPTKAELDSGTATFICLAKQFYPEKHTFKWFQDSTEVQSSVAESCVGKKKTNVTLYTATSILQLKADVWTTKPGTKIKCKFEHDAGNKIKEVSNTVSSTDTCISANFIPPTWEDMLKKKGGNLKCRAQGEQGFNKMKITASGRLINESHGSVLANEKVVELDASISFVEWTNGTQFVCTIEHESTAEPIEITYMRESGGDKKRPSVYILAPPEQKDGEQVTLTCYVKDFYPMEVFVSWLADDVPLVVGDEYMQNTSVPMLNNDYFSVYSQLTFPSDKWKSGTVFSCVVYHESIDESLKTLTRSISNDSEKPSIFNLSLNTNSLCKG